MGASYIREFTVIILEITLSKLLPNLPGANQFNILNLKWDIASSEHLLKAINLIFVGTIRPNHLKYDLLTQRGLNMTADI